MPPQPSSLIRMPKGTLFVHLQSSVFHSHSFNPFIVYFHSLSTFTLIPTLPPCFALYCPALYRFLELTNHVATCVLDASFNMKT